MANIEAKVEKLTAHNYPIWKIIMQSQLKGKDLWDYCLTAKQENDEDLVNNEQAKTLMYLSMDTKQIAATGVCETAFHLWEKIRENHEGALSNLQSSSLAEFLGFKFRKNESIISYAGRYENALGKLLSTNQRVDERTKLWVFSNSLPQHMKLTVQMFTMANPNGRVSELISQLKIQYHMDGHDNDRHDAAYHLKDKHQQQSSNKPHPKPMSSIECNYCKKQGHMWKECRKLKYDNERKKRFGQTSPQRQPERNQSRPYQSGQKQYSQPNQSYRQNQNKNRNTNYNQNRSQNNYQNKNKSWNRNQTRSAGAFSTKKHIFSEGKHTWIVDSGASSHMTPYKEFLTDYEEFEKPHKIYLGNNEPLEVCGKGTMPFVANEFEGELKNVLWVPEITENLFSTGRAMEQNCSVEFCKDKSEVLFYRNNKLVLKGVKSPNSIYFLLYLKPLHGDFEDAALIGASLEDWHKRLVHCSMSTVKALIKSNAVTGLKIDNNEQHECRACTQGKLCRAHHPQREKIKASESAAVLHIDTVGPMKTPSIGGSRYFILATEEFSGYKYFEALSMKSLIPDAVKRIINQAELESGRIVKAILTDNGTEYTNHDFNRWVRKRGVVHSFSASYTPEQNGRAERANRTVLEGIRTLISDSKLPEELWAEALNTIVYTTNRIFSKKDQTKTRYELFRGKKPDISNLKIFGQRAIIRESDNVREGKLAPRGIEVIFVGYTDRHNTYRFYHDIPIQQIVISCDAKFFSLLRNRITGPRAQTYKTIIGNDDPTTMDHDYYQSVESYDPNESAPHEPTPDQPENDDDETEVETSNAESEHVPPEETSSDSDDSRMIEIEPDGSVRVVPNKRRVLRSYTKRRQERDGPAVVGVREGAMFTLDDEPLTMKDAQEGNDWPKWKKAMDEEIEALEKNKTWQLVDKPSHIKPIKNKWVYKVKLKPDGSIERYKARLVAKGFTQIQNVDYKETYAPVASMTTIRMFLAIANQNSMRIVQFDIKTAFLYGDLEEELYMEQPENYVKDANKVCKLIKSLYGLKQAPRQWNKKFDSFLKLFQLEQSSVDKCLYYNHDKTMLLAIYVDDGLAAGRDQNQLDKLIKYLKDNFEMKVMECESYLGFEISRDLNRKTLDIHQAHYVDKILHKFGMFDSKPVSTPEEVGAKFEESTPLPADNQFKELVGSLLYLTTCTRPDIAHAVSIASRTSQPTQAHWVALKRILRYLKGTKDLGIRFRWENPNQLIGYSDADYANDAETRKSTTGYCIYFGGGPIAWRCQRQPIITLSTTEAEYVAGCELVKEILPIRQQLIELGQIEEKEPTKIYIDNQSTVKIASNEGGQNRTKHIDIREKWLTEQVTKKKIVVEHISGEEQAADILTKPLYKPKFISNRSKLLTQVISVLAMVALCASSIEGRLLKPTDPLTPVKTDKVLIKGDTRYSLATIFYNPCDRLFNYSTTLYNTEHLIRYCYDYFEKKHLGALSHCKRQPNIGPDLKLIPLTYNCVETVNNGDQPHGKCEVNRRDAKSTESHNYELENVLDRWNLHKKKVEQLTSLRREKRFIPALILGGMAVLGVIAGPAVKTYKQTNSNTDSIDQLVNLTSQHSDIIKESTKYLDDFINSVQALHSWSDDVEEKLGSDPLLSRLNNDPIYRGKKASLIKNYMQWFDAQEKLLNDINMATASRKISLSLKNMLNGTDSFDIAANLSTLLSCEYRLENKSMVLELEFYLPTVDENVDILKLLSTDLYKLRNNTDDNQMEACWDTYTGPDYMMLNKTNGCLKAISLNKNTQTAIRGQTCTEPVNELNDLRQESPTWTQQSCTKEVPKILDRVQITEIEGIHKIYCYPYTIEFINEQQQCPNLPFILEGHATYKIDKITHHGSYVDSTVSRQVRSVNSDRVKRVKRSPTPAPVAIGLPAITAGTPTITVTAKQVLSTETPPIPPKIKVGETLANLTGSMNSTLIRIKESLRSLPDRLNITRANFDSFLDAPFNLIGSNLERLIDYIKSLGSTLGLLTAVMMFIIIMPALEIIMIALRIVRIPANMWLGSARRVSSNVRWASSASLDNLPRLFRSKRKRWNDTVKMT